MKSIDSRLPRNTVYSIKDTRKNKNKIGLKGKGVFRTDLNLIFLDARHKTNPRLNYHEKGHYIWHNRLSAFKKEVWRNLIRKEKLYIDIVDRSHGTSVAEETFAIFYAHYKQGLLFDKYGKNIKLYFRKLIG